MTTDRAASLGFTHSGHLHGIPVWVADPDSDAPGIAAKNWFYGIALDVSEIVFGTLVFLGLRQPIYEIRIDAPIARE